MMKKYATVLSVAGSDSVGGAGIQADIKACTALGVYAMTAITALTAQNTRGVRAVEAVSPSMLRAQLDTVLEDVRPDALKTGMLPNADAVEAVAECMRRYSLRNLVVDPVLVATSGDALAEGGVGHAILEKLAPLCALITPNIPEATALSGLEITDRDSMTAAAEKLRKQAGCAVLLKGGHAEGNTHPDLLLTKEGEALWFEHPHIETENTHGTGCSLSSAIASFLALGYPLAEAARRGVDWLHGAIAAGAGYSLGHGHGPVKHFYTISSEIPEYHANNSKQ